VEKNDFEVVYEGIWLLYLSCFFENFSKCQLQTQDVYGNCCLKATHSRGREIFFYRFEWQALYDSFGKYRHYTKKC
jgi:hypothetical protein